MLEVITEYDIYGKGYKSEFYSIYCLKKDIEFIDKRYKNQYDYETIIKITKYKNSRCNKWLSINKSEISSGIPYGVVVFNLDYNAKMELSPATTRGNFNMKCYEVSLNEWKCRKTLQLKIRQQDLINKQIKDVLKDCYDNIIIIDFGFDYILVIENIPMYSYFSIIDINKHNNNYPIKYYYYDDEYVKKYITKRQNRESFDDLLDVLPKPDKIKKKKQEEDGVDLSKAPAYKKYLEMKKKQKKL